MSMRLAPQDFRNAVKENRGRGAAPLIAQERFIDVDAFCPQDFRNAVKENRGRGAAPLIAQERFIDVDASSPPGFP